LSCALLVLASTVLADAPTEDKKPDPSAIAKACIARMKRTADHRIVANRKLTTRTVAAVERLMAAGQEERAKRVAHAAIQRINKTSQHSAAAIQKRCDVCVKLLHRLGAGPKLIHTVQAACKYQRGRVYHSRAASIAKIRRALGD